MMSARRLRFANRAALHATSAARPRTARRRSRASLQAAWRSDASRPLCAYRLAAEAGQAQSSLETAPASPMLRLVQGGARVTRAAHLLWTEVSRARTRRRLAFTDTRGKISWESCSWHDCRMLLASSWTTLVQRILRSCLRGANAWGRYSAGREEHSALPKRRPCQCHGRVTLTHAMCTQVVQPGDLVVDATCGNGHDTLALAQLVGPRGTVHAFDLQPAAIDSTRSQLNDHCKDGAAPAVHLHCESHAQMRERVPDDSAALVAFNLGYLPHGDHSVVTEAATTTVAVRSALQVRTEAVCLACTVCGSACNGGAREHERCLRSVARDAWVSCAVPQGAGSLHHHCVCRPRPGRHRARGCGAAAASAAFGRIRVPGDDATQSQPGAAAAERLEGTQWRKYSVDRRHVTAGPRCPAAGARDAVEMVRMLCWHVLQAVDRRN